MIVVCGSINMDITGYAERLPRPGETIHGHRYVTGLGGKGANQAVAAARLGAETCLIGRTGKDTFGADAIRALSDFGVDTGNIIIDEHNPTGIALISVAASGENAITVIAGANMAMGASDAERAASTCARAKALLLQMEIPVEASLSAARSAKGNGAIVILDPAPASGPLPGALLQQIDILTPNEVETEILTGERPQDEQGARRAAEALHTRGAAVVLIKLGAKGVYMSGPAEARHIPSFHVTAIDTVAAGDCFNGGLAYALSQGEGMLEAVRFASACGALSTTRLGAAAAAPDLAEVQGFLARS